MGTDASRITAGEAIAAVEAALDALASTALEGSPETRLELIASLKSVVDRGTSLLSVWVAEADRTGAARRAAGTTTTDWLASATHADASEAAGILRSGKELLSSPALKQAATSGSVTPRQAKGITKTLGQLPPSLSAGWWNRHGSTLRTPRTGGRSRWSGVAPG